MKWLLRIGYVLIASVVGFIFASMLHTQAVLAKLTDIGIIITLNDRLSTTWQDMLGLAPTYGIIILIGLTIAFSVTGLLNKKLHTKGTFLYPLAGGVAMLVMLLAMQPILNVSLIAGSRGTAGLVMQVIAGLIAGVCFARLIKKKNATIDS
jgi:cellobiose-specific phosphotransferase system component IIC